MSSQIVNPYQNFMGLNAVPIQNGYIYIGVENQDPESYPIAVYWDNGLTIPASQPIRTIGGYYSNGGTPGQLFAAGRYSIRVKDSTGTQVFYSASSQFAGAYLSITGGDMTGAINWAKGTDIPSAALTDIASATGNYVNVTGSTTITSLGTAQAGAFRLVRFTGSLKITHNAASLILPAAASITVYTDDVAGFISEGSGNWRCVYFVRSTGLPNITSRQSVLYGATDGSGNANIITVGTGLQPLLSATAKAVVATFAYGFDGRGGVDFVGSIDADTSFPAVTGSQTVSSATNAISCVVTTASAHNLVVGSWVTLSGFTPSGYNGTYQITAVTSTTFTITLSSAPGATTVIGSYTVANYLYIDRNISTGALTLGSVILAPSTQNTAASTTNLQHTYVTPEAKMYVGNGTTASAVQRVFVGVANAGAASISSVSSYPFASGGGIRTVKRVVITASGTYTPSSGLVFADVEIVGGGGSGGNKSSGSTGTCSSGAGGAYTRKRFTSAEIGSSQSVTIGAGGAAQSSAGSNGNAGGTSSFGTLLVVTGGTGGIGFLATIPAAGGTVTTGGDYSVAGGAGGMGGNAGTASPYGFSSGNGGSTPLGIGGGNIFSISNATVAGAAGTGFGSGSSAGFGGGTGAAGQPGVCIITEYLSA